MKITFFMKSCFIQHKAPLREDVNVTQKIYSFRWEFFIIIQFQLHFSVFDACIVSVTVNYNIQLVHTSFETYDYFSPTFVYCPL